MARQRINAKNQLKASGSLGHADGAATSEGQTVIDVSPKTFVAGSLRVYVGGSRLTSGQDFTIDSASQITLNIGMPDTTVWSMDWDEASYIVNDSNSVNGIQASATPVANKLLALNGASRFPVSVLPVGGVMQTVREDFLTTVSYAGSTPLQDDSLPLNSEGAFITSAIITPLSAANILRVTAVAHLGANGSVCAVCWVNRDGGNALGASYTQAGNNSGVGGVCVISFDEAAGSISPTTFNFRFGVNTSTTVVVNGGTVRIYGGSVHAFIKIEEIAA